MSCFSISMYTMMIYTHLDALFLYFYVHHDNLYTPGRCPVSLFLCTPWFIHTWTMSCFFISMYTKMIYSHLDNVLFLYFYVHQDDLFTPGQCPVSLFLCTPWWFIHTWTMSCFCISMYTKMIYTHLNNVLFLYFYVHHDDLYTPGRCPVSLFQCTSWWFIYTMVINTHLDDVLFLYFYVHHDDLYTPGRCPVSLFLCTPWWFRCLCPWFSACWHWGTLWWHHSLRHYTLCINKVPHNSY